MTNYENFKRALSFVFGNEGGYSNDPLDRGGETNLGITQSTLDRARREGIGRLPQSVKDLKREQAEEIYRILYWRASKAEELPYPLCVLHFDAAVNHGVGGAGKLLQKTINNYAVKAGLSVRVNEDGAVGPKTLDALDECIAAKNNIALICTIYCNEREKFYRAIVASRPDQSRFLRGWLNRLDRNRALIA